MKEDNKLSSVTDYKPLENTIDTYTQSNIQVKSCLSGITINGQPFGSDLYTLDSISSYSIDFTYEKFTEADKYIREAITAIDDVIKGIDEQIEANWVLVEEKTVEKTELAFKLDEVTALNANGNVDTYGYRPTYDIKAIQNRITSLSNEMDELRSDIKKLEKIRDENYKVEREKLYTLLNKTRTHISYIEYIEHKSNTWHEWVNDEVVSSTTRITDNRGIEIAKQKRVYDDSTHYTTTLYDMNGNIKKVESFSEDNGVRNVYTSTYNENNQVITKDASYNNAKSNIHIDYSYYENGYICTEKIYDKNTHNYTVNMYSGSTENDKTAVSTYHINAFGVEVDKKIDYYNNNIKIRTDIFKNGKVVETIDYK